MIICPGFKKSEVLLSQKCKKGKLYSTESGDYWRSYNCSAISLPKSGPIHRSGSSCDSCYKFECHLRRRLTVNQRVGSYRIAFRKLFNAKRTILRRDKALKVISSLNLFISFSLIIASNVLYFRNWRKTLCI